jgi:hypothetical protein
MSQVSSQHLKLLSSHIGMGNHNPIDEGMFTARQNGFEIIPKKVANCFFSIHSKD